MTEGMQHDYGIYSKCLKFQAGEEESRSLLTATFFFQLSYTCTRNVETRTCTVFFIRCEGPGYSEE